MHAKDRRRLGDLGVLLGVLCASLLFETAQSRSRSIAISGLSAGGIG